MNAPQGLATFPGIADIIGASFALSHGTTASTGTLTTVPHAHFLPTVGDLEFSYAGKIVVLRQCLISFASLRVDGSGQVWDLTVKDRRWKWERTGTIDGFYNRRLPNKGVHPFGEKTPQQLASLLLDAMGEQGYDVSALPNAARPEVKWLAAHPATELARLCDELGCRVVLGTDDRVYIRETGVGNQKFPDGKEVTDAFQFTPNTSPDSIRVVAQPTVVQAKFHLVPVAEDIDGQILHLDDVSYKPTGGWGTVAPDAISTFSVPGKYTTKDGVERDIADLAQENVYRRYSIVMDSPHGRVADARSAIGQAVGRDPHHLTGYDILPLLPDLNDTYIDAEGRQVRRQAFVEGHFYDREGIGAPSAGIRKYLGGFSLDGKRGIVNFSEPVTELVGDDIVEARLWLTCTFNVRMQDGHPHYLYEDLVLVNPPRGTGPLVIHRDDITYRVTQHYNVDGIGDQQVFEFEVQDSNEAEVQAQGQFYATAAAREFIPVPAGTIEYTGIHAQQLDGEVQQVTWRVGYGQPAVTHVSRNTERSLYKPTYAERLRQQKVQAFLGGAPSFNP